MKLGLGSSLQRAQEAGEPPSGVHILGYHILLYQCPREVLPTLIFPDGNGSIQEADCKDFFRFFLRKNFSRKSLVLQDPCLGISET